MLDNEYAQEKKILEAKKINIKADGFRNGLTQKQVDLLIEQLDKELELLRIKNNNDKQTVIIDDKDEKREAPKVLFENILSGNNVFGSLADSFAK